MASLSGDCHRVSCTPGCQHLVNDVRSACKTVKCNETDLFTGVTKIRSYLQKIMPSISQLGPVDCDYAISEQHCQASCSMYNITAGAGVSFYELHNCIAVDPQSGQSSPEAVWKSCEGICKTKFEDLVGSCSTCGSLRFSNFMQDAGRKLARCGIGNGQSCARVLDVIDTACCPGNTSSCSVKNGNTPANCLASGVCMGAVQTGAIHCAHNFIHNPQLLGLFEDCGGSMAQLLAVEPVSTRAPLYCDAIPAAIGGRRLMHSSPPSEAMQLGERMVAKALAYDDSQRRTEIANSDPSSTLVPSHTRKLAEDAPAYPADPACSEAYSEVFTAALFGSCSGYNASETHNAFNPACLHSCQKAIDKMLRMCKNETVTETVGGVVVRHSFVQKASNALQVLGAPACVYHLGRDECDRDVCTLAALIHKLEDGKCAEINTSPSVYISEWKACSGGSNTCWDQFATLAQKCGGCQDGPIKELLEQVATKSAGSECFVQGGCKDPATVATDIKSVCCAGRDGKVGTGDDPCKEHKEGDVSWHVPDSCTENQVCAKYVTGLAEGACPVTFADSDAGRQIYSDCGGDIQTLIESGPPCDLNAFLANGLLSKGTTKTPGINHAGWGSCALNANHTGPYLTSGQTCDMTCDTGWCVQGGQAHCLNGKVTIPGNTIGSSAIMQCAVAPISSCDIPPNGGCDPHTTCSIGSVEFFGSVILQVECGACPAGYLPKGDNILPGERCVDQNECQMRSNGGCDAHTQCINSDGGYSCTECPPDFRGTDGQFDSHRENGCCPADKTYVAVGDQFAECRSCSDGESYDRNAGQCTRGESTFEDLFTLGTGKSGMGFVTVLLIIVVVAAIVAGICHLCGKKSYKDGAVGKFETIDVGSIGTGPSIYDTSWAR